MRSQLAGRGGAGSPGHGAAAAPPIRVLVANRDVPEGGLITADAVRWQAWPADDPTTAYLVQGKVRVQDLVGGVARSPLAAGEPLTTERVARAGDGGSLAAMLTPGARAITVNVSPNTGLSGLIVPGDHVDLILTLTVPSRDKQGAAHHVSETVLRDVRVAGLDQSLTAAVKSDKKDDKKDVSPAKTATLEVTPKQAEIVSVAADVGVLSLSLRSLGQPDGSDAADPPTHTWDTDAAKGLLGGSPSDGTRHVGPPPDFRRRVVVVRGDAITEVFISPHAMKAAVTP